MKVLYVNENLVYYNLVMLQNYIIQCDLVYYWLVWL